MKTTIRFSLLNVLLLVALVAGVCGTIQVFWNPNWGNHDIFFGLYCVVLSAMTTGAICAGQPARHLWVGMAVFGWTYLAFVLKGGFGVSTIGESNYFSMNVKLGIALFFLSGLATHLCFSIFSEKSSKG